MNATQLDHDASDEALAGPVRDTRLVWAGLFLCLAVFAKLPLLDLWVSQHYWRRGEGFFAAETPWVRFSYFYVPEIGRVLLVIALLTLLIAPGVARLARRQASARAATLVRQARLWQRTAIALILVGALSSGLIIDVSLKGSVGRPRPVHTMDFGGTETYLAPFTWGKDPHRHKSFTSGHAATGFSLMALGLCASPAWRRRWFFVGLFTGGVIGWGRIMQGGHYLSDVLFSFYIVWLTCELVAYGFRRYDLAQLPPHHPDRIGPRSPLR